MYPNSPSSIANLEQDNFILGGGEMGALIRTFDWAKTSLGPIETWPQSLQTAVNIVLQSPVPLVMLWGPDGIMLYNDAYSVFAGGRHPFLLGSKVVEGWPEVADFNRNVMDKVLRGETLSYKDQQLTLYRNELPEEVCMDLNYSPIMDESGKPAGVLAIVMETTQRIRAEQRLHRAEERFHMAMGAAGMVGVYDWHIQEDVIYTDARFATLFSVDPEKGELGTPLAEYVAGIHPDDVDRVLEAVQRTVATGEKYSIEYRLCQKDGSVRWVLVRGECLYDESGKPWRFPGAAVDITERKNAEEKLKYREQQLNSIFNQAASGIAQVDLTGKFTLVNQRYCEMFGRPQEELYQMRMQDVTHPDDLPRNLPLFERCIKDGTPFSLEKRYIRPDGSIVWVNNYVSRITDSLGNPTHILAVSHDITEQKQIEEALRESEERFRTLADNAPLLIFIADINAITLYRNKTLVEFLGLQDHPNPCDPSLSITNFAHPDDVEVLKERYYPSFERQERYALEIRLLKADGQYRWIHSEGVPRYDNNRNFQGFIGIALDITERKEAELALKESEARFRAIADEAPVFIFMAGENAEADFHNKTWLDYAGLSLGASLGRGWEEVTHPDDRDLVNQTYTRAFNLREPYTFVIRQRGVDGEYRWILWKGIPRFMPNGGFIGFMGIGIDIHERKLAEAALTESEERFRLVVSGANDGIWDWNLITNDIYWNDRLYEMLGLTRESYIPTPQSFSALIHPDDLPSSMDLFQNHLADPSVKYKIEYRVKHSEGHYIHTLARGEAQRDSSGTPTRVTGINTDITAIQKAKEELKEYARKLEESNKDLEQFALVASHDLQEPLRKVMTFSHYIQEAKGNVLTDESQDYIDRMQNATKRMQALIKDLLDLSRVNRKGQPFQRTNLNRVIQEVLSDLHFALRDSQGKVEVEELLTIDADPKQMHQLFQNLIGNALKFRQIDSPPIVKVSARKKDALFCEIEVKDNGIGFDNQFSERIFGIFERLHGRSEYSGTGVGLAICQKIVARHGGNISATSVPGEGSTFTVSLPLQQ